MTGGSQRFSDMEQQVLRYWDLDQTFQASCDNRETSPEYVFYDGPPFANGLPHYGHLLTGYVKDIIPRYKTMRGYKVARVFGWDCHGLPAELEAEKQLGIKDKGQIEAMGLEKFNEYCAQSVLQYTEEWKAYVTRQARWVDFDNGYQTMDVLGAPLLAGVVMKDITRRGYLNKKDTAVSLLEQESTSELSNEIVSSKFKPRGTGPKP